MTSTSSDHNGSNQQAQPPHDQMRQSPTPHEDNTKQAERSTEQEAVVAIMTVWPPSLEVTPQEMAQYEEGIRLAALLPPPGDDEDDFAHLPSTKPYDPNIDNEYDWAKPEAWAEEKDSEGRTMWRNRITASTNYSMPWCLRGQEKGNSTNNQHAGRDPGDRGSEGPMRK